MRCEKCGFIDEIDIRPRRSFRGVDNGFFSPCPACGHATGVYVEVAA